MTPMLDFLARHAVAILAAWTVGLFFAVALCQAAREENR